MKTESAVCGFTPGIVSQPAAVSSRALAPKRRRDTPQKIHAAEARRASIVLYPAPERHWRRTGGGLNGEEEQQMIETSATVPAAARTSLLSSFIPGRRLPGQPTGAAPNGSATLRHRPLLELPVAASGSLPRLERPRRLVA